MWVKGWFGQASVGLCRALNCIRCSRAIKHTRLLPLKKGTEGSLLFSVLVISKRREECVKEGRKDGAEGTEDVRPQQDVCSSCISVNKCLLC